MLDGVELTLDKKALKQTQALLKAFPSVLAQSLAVALLAIAKVVQAQAKQSLRDEEAIDLGALRASIQIAVLGPLTVVVGTPLEYAAAVEFGTVGHTVKVDDTPGMREWLVRHGIPDAEDRTYFFVHPKPRPFLEPGRLMGEALAPATIEKAIERAFAEVEKYLK